MSDRTMIPIKLATAARVARFAIALALSSRAGTALAAEPLAPPPASPAATEVPSSAAPTPATDTPTAATPTAPAEAAPVSMPDGAPAPTTAPVDEATSADAAANNGEFYGANAADAADAAVTYPKLELSGFTDFTFIANVSPRSSPLRTILQPYSSFSIGNLNLYLSAALAERWHMLAEVRFLYLPQGVTNYPTQAGQQVAPFDAGALDYAADSRPLTWGGVQIQRVQIDYALHPLFSLRFGQWLTPVGIWNVDHGSPVVIGVYRPYVIGQGLFPERQTGIQLSGEWNGVTNALGYFLTLSNGRGPSDSYSDLDANKALGGRFYWTNTGFGTLTLGMSGYKGTYASRNLQFGYMTPPGQAPELTAVSPLTVRYREQSIAADARWQYKGLLLQGEVMQHEVVYDEGLRPVTDGVVFSNYRERGLYVLAGYRTPWLGTMPFATFESYNFASQPYVAPVVSLSGGLNVRPVPTVVFKFQYNWAQIGTDSSAEPYRGTLRRFLTQLAVAF